MNNKIDKLDLPDVPESAVGVSEKLKKMGFGKEKLDDSTSGADLVAAEVGQNVRSISTRTQALQKEDQQEELNFSLLSEDDFSQEKPKSPAEFGSGDGGGGLESTPLIISRNNPLSWIAVIGSCISLLAVYLTYGKTSDLEKELSRLGKGEKVFRALLDKLPEDQSKADIEQVLDFFYFARGEYAKIGKPAVAAVKPEEKKAESVPAVQAAPVEKEKAVVAAPVPVAAPAAPKKDELAAIIAQMQARAQGLKSPEATAEKK